MLEEEKLMIGLVKGNRIRQNWQWIDAGGRQWKDWFDSRMSLRQINTTVKWIHEGAAVH
jgi:hypothetical protein